jgi:hypothetical protein
VLTWRVAIAVLGGLVLFGLQAALHGLAHLSTDVILRLVAGPALGVGFLVCLAGLVHALHRVNRELWHQVDTMAEDIDDLRESAHRLRDKTTEATPAGSDGHLPSPEGWASW